MTTRDAMALLLDHSVLKPEATASDVAAGARVVREWCDRVLLRAAVVGARRGRRARRQPRPRRRRGRFSARLRAERGEGARLPAWRSPTAPPSSTWC